MSRSSSAIRTRRRATSQIDALPSVALTADEIADAAQGRFVRPSLGMHGAGDGLALRLVDAAGLIVGMGRREGGRIAPTKILPR